MRTLASLILVVILAGGCGSNESDPSLADSVVGTWVTELVGAYVEFREDGTYDAGHTLGEADLESGTWSIEGNVLTETPSAEAEACTSVGTYEVDLVDNGNRLDVIVLEDACDARREDFGSGLTRYVEPES